MKVLITGDSFAADWQVKYPEVLGWPNFLAKEYLVTNLAQAGCGEYKILKQLQSVDLSKFDLIIVAHSSPFRIYVKNHPIHKDDKLHSNCDLIYSDIKDHVHTNHNLLPIVDYFENYFDQKYAVDIHNLICEKIDKLTNAYKTIHITGFEWDKLYQFDNMINFNYVLKKYKGMINHYTVEGNREVYNVIKSRINLESSVKDFYSTLQFPGHYTLENLEYYDDIVINPYLKFYDEAVQGNTTVLDIGCGSGFITNFLARRHKTVKFDAVDFSNSINYAKEFSQRNHINNINFFQENFLDWQPDHNYDLVICNGVLHHIPKFNRAVDKIKTLANKKIALGVYNTYGKILKKYVKIKYKNKILHDDQELCPFELKFTDNQIRKLFSGSNLLETYPGIKTHFVDICNLINFSNGGLTLYLFNNEKAV